MKRLLTSLTAITILSSATYAQDREEKRDRPAAQRTVDWDQIKTRVEAAVERGEMTRDQANAKYTEIKKNLAARDAHQGEQKHDRPDLSREARLKMLLGRLVESQQISREVAGQIHQLAFEGHEKPRENGERNEHLEELAGELKGLINRARHELEEIKKTREHLGGERRERAELDERRAHEREAHMKAEAHRRAEMERVEVMKRQQLEMRNKAEAHAREMQQKRMIEEKKKHAEARERAEMEHKKEREHLEKEKTKEKEQSEKREKENDKKREKEEKKDRD